MGWPHERLGWLGARFLAGLVVLGFWGPAVARAQEAKASAELTALIARVDPCVVTITLKHSQGSGFVIDSSGIIATNYHVIEGASSAEVVFPDKKSYPVEGFLTVVPNKDLALIRIRNPKAFPTLPLAANPPVKGERVFAFGAPMGMSGSVSDGIVASLRTGEEVRTLLRNGSGKDVYTSVLGYDIETSWIQTTAPISPGNSGGPLVNAQGEVIGINTWQNRLGQNVNFSVAIAHLQELLKRSDWDVQPLRALPAARHRATGDGDANLTAWKDVNHWKLELRDKIVACEKRMSTIPAANPRYPERGAAMRQKRKATEYHAMGQAYSAFATKVKSIKTSELDPDLVVLMVGEADIAQRKGDDCEKLASADISVSPRDILQMEFMFRNGYDRATANLRTLRDVTRAALSLKYHKDFPTLEQTATGEDGEADSQTASDDKKPAAPPVAAADREALRTWTDSSGSYHLKAKFKGLKDGQVSLERTDGSLIMMPIDKLSDADQRFVNSLK